MNTGRAYRVFCRGAVGLLCLAVGACSSLEERDGGVDSVHRIYLDDEGSKELEYNFMYDGSGRVSQVGVSRRVPMGVNNGSINVSDNYVYDYRNPDTISIIRQGMDYDGVTGTVMPHTSSIFVEMASGIRVSVLEDTMEGIRMEYEYDVQGQLVGVGKSWGNPSESASTDFHVAIAWEDGNMVRLESGNQVYGFGYGSAPLDNTLSVDILCWMLEREFLEEIPLWSIGLQGVANRNLPSYVYIQESNGERRLAEFSYTTDGSNLTGFSIEYLLNPGREESFVIEYD